LKVSFIRREWDSFAKHVRYEVGDGSSVLFWHDVWCVEQPLKVSFPKLFTIACGKDACMADNMQLQNGNIHWNIIFTKPVHDWEVEVVSGFFEFLYSQRVRHGGEDTICWIPSKKKTFEVKSYYQVLSNNVRSNFP
jgi:hypothetical protein